MVKEKNSKKKSTVERVEKSKEKKKSPKKKAETEVVESFMFEIFPIPNKSSPEDQIKKRRPKRKKIPANPIIVID